MARRTEAQRAHDLVELAQLAAHGWTQARLAAHFGCSRTTIRRDLARIAATHRATATRAVSYRPTKLKTPAGKRAVAVEGGRLTMDRPRRVGTLGTAIVPPPNYEGYWRTTDLDRDTLSKASPAQLIEVLTAISPEVSRATWDFLRLFDPGHEIKALVVGSEDVEHAAGQAALDAFLGELDRLHGSRSVVMGRLAMGAWMRGAFLAELVLDPIGRAPVDLATPDPWTVRFRERLDETRGVVWEMGQWQAGQFVVLDRPTIAYVPVDPLPGSPYGRAPVAPALFPAIFLLGFFHDLRRVVAQQGYPRIDLAVITEKIRAAYQDDDEEAFSARVQEIVDEIVDAYADLEPDDAYVHPDWVAVTRAVGAVDASALGAAGSLIAALERLCVKALKTMPLMMGITDGVSEANANRQWEMLAAGVKSLQHLCESMLERLLTLALEAQGIAAEVRVRFAELRAAEEYRDEQTLQLKLDNAARMEELGYGDRDEASDHALGHPAKVAERPMVAANVADSAEEAEGEVPPAGEAVAEPGSNRAGDESWWATAMPRLRAAALPLDVKLAWARRLAVASERQRPAVVAELDELVRGAGDSVTPVGADVTLPALPDRVRITDDDGERASGAFNVAVPDYAGLLDAALAEDDDGEEAA